MPAIRTFHHWPKSLDPQIHACIHFFQLMAPPVTTLNKGNLRCMRRPIWFRDWLWSVTFVIKSGISWMMYCGSLLVSQRQTKRDILRAVFLYAALAQIFHRRRVGTQVREELAPQCGKQFDSSVSWLQHQFCRKAQALHAIMWMFYEWHDKIVRYGWYWSANGGYPCVSL